MGTLATVPAGRRRPPRAAGCEEPPRLWREAAPATPAPAASTTLDDLITGAWEGLSAAVAVACPVCPAAMAPQWSAGAGVVGGRCARCGSTLS